MIKRFPRAARQNGRRLTAPLGAAGKAASAALGASLIAILFLSSVVDAILPSFARGAGRPPAAYLARTLSAIDTAHLRYIRSSGSLLFEEGSASGGLSGSMRATLTVGATFSASFTIYTRVGAIRGHGTATPHGSGRYESFSGSLVVSGGSGRYSHARGRAGLYGTFDRKTYALVVQTTGKLHY
jgi:hypothetical protein